MPEVKVTVRNNGPLRIEGENITLCDESGRTWGLAGRTAVSLCRCGQSANKPFCDAAHKTCGFTAPSVAFDLAPPAPMPGA